MKENKIKIENEYDFCFSEDILKFGQFEIRKLDKENGYNIKKINKRRSELFLSDTTMEKGNERMSTVFYDDKKNNFFFDTNYPKNKKFVKGYYVARVRLGKIIINQISKVSYENKVKNLAKSKGH